MQSRPHGTRVIDDSQSLTFAIVPVPADPGVKESTLEAEIFSVSLGAAVGVERSFAFLSIKSFQSDGNAGQCNMCGTSIVNMSWPLCM